MDTETTDRALGGAFRLAGTDTTVRRLGYGAMQLAGPHVWGPPPDEAAARSLLRDVLDAGIDHIDTSDFYGPHVTNHLIREALHPYPERLTIVTKVGFRRGDDGSWLPAAAPDELRAAVHDNLRNLGLDALDVVNLRVPDAPATVPVEEQIGVLADLRRDGLVRHLGISNATAEQVAAARATAPIVCVQNHYTLAHREDDALVDALAADGIAYVPYFPLGGFTPLQSKALDDEAKTLGATPMQVALAWLLQRAPNVLAIPGTRSPAHLAENVAAASLALGPDGVARLDAIATAVPRSASRA